MKKLNTKLKTLAVVASLSTIPNVSQAAFGIGDFNILDVPQYMAKLASMVEDGLATAMKPVMDGVQFKQQIKLHEIKHKAEIAMKTMPSADACAIILQQAAIKNVVMGGNNSTRKLNKTTQTRANSTTSDDAHAVSMMRKTQTVSCTDEQRDFNINQCGRMVDGKPITTKDNLMGNSDRTVESLSGATAQLNGKTFTTGSIIPRNKWLDKEYRGEDVVDLVVEKGAGEVPVIVTNRVVNSTARGQAYNNEATKYNIRRSIVADTLNKHAAEHMEIDEKSAAGVRDYWRSAETQEIMKEIYGEDYNINKNNPDGSTVDILDPSPLALLELSVIKEFQESEAVTRSTSASGDKKNTELLIVNNYLTLKLYKEQQQTNMLLQAILAQSLDPVTKQSLKLSLDNAEGKVLTK